MQLLTGITKTGRKRLFRRNNMKLLDRLTKWFFNTTKIEINADWKLVALDEHRENVELRKQLQQANQTIADKDKIIEIYKEKSK